MAGAGAGGHGFIAPSLLDDRMTFQTFCPDLDKRILKAVAKCGFVYPTLVQSKTVPLALEGRDLLVKAKTGSGKTLAYLVPLLQKLLAGVGAGGLAGGVKALVLVPTRELADQTRAALHELMYYCKDVCRMVALFGGHVQEQIASLRDAPDIIIATPGQLVKHLTAGRVSLSNLETLVIDEADLVLLNGYSEDVATVVQGLPSICQTFLMSATMSPDLEHLKKTVLHSPAVLRLEEGPTDGHLTQYFVEVSSNDKYLLLFALLKLRLIAGKALFFVNDIDSCYRLKLFLEKFSIPAAVLNAELPANSRDHILMQFNRGMFDYLIATDESVGPPLDKGALGDEDGSDAGSGSGSGSDSDSGEDSAEESGSDSGSGSGSGSDSDSDSEADSDDEASKKKATKQKAKKGKEEKAGDAKKSEDGAAKSKVAAKPAAKGKRGVKRGREVKKDAEYGVARGVDFKGVSTVVNVDFPTSASAYIHRIGRTARGGASGAALSFVGLGSPDEHRVLAELQAMQPPTEEGYAQPVPLPFNKQEIEGFRYRVEDVRRSVTGVRVKEARVAELKHEIMNSKKLQAHFEDNPKELEVLTHDKPLQPARVMPHLADVPDYLVPPTLRAAAEAAGGGVDTSAKRRRKGPNSAWTGASAGRGSDPLKSFAVNAKRLGGPVGSVAMPVSVAAAGESTSNRQAWQRRHRRGKWNPKTKRHKSKSNFYT